MLAPIRRAAPVISAHCPESSSDTGMLEKSFTLTPTLMHARCVFAHH
jgi:hypothetical protein